MSDRPRRCSVCEPTSSRMVAYTEDFLGCSPRLPLSGAGSQKKGCQVPLQDSGFRKRSSGPLQPGAQPAFGKGFI
jgi:hypothetical protein